MDANEMQVGGNHYNAPYQHWDFVVDALHNRYLEGQVTKYVTRWRKKNGIQDLQKACHYLKKLIELFVDGKYPAMPPVSSRGDMQSLLQKFWMANDITGTLDHYIFSSIVEWSDLETLCAIEAWLEELINIAEDEEQPVLSRTVQDVDNDSRN
jgi:hypothetical protein